MKSLTQIRIVVCLALFFALVAHPSSAKACSYFEGTTIANEFTQSDAVFTGKVARVIDNYTSIFSTLDSIMFNFGFHPYFFDKGEKRLGFSVFFKVINSWKGVDNTIIDIATGRGGGDCGYTFDRDQEYLVYASHAYGIPDNYWVTGICGRTAKLSNATEDLEYLSKVPTLSLKSTLSIMLAEKDLIYASLFILTGFVVLITWRLTKRNRLSV